MANIQVYYFTLIPLCKTDLSLNCVVFHLSKFQGTLLTTASRVKLVTWLTEEILFYLLKCSGSILISNLY